MTTDRSYRAALPHDAALAELRGVPRRSSIHASSPL
jgi:HD-GYP domain-containing protein (c-di-GMP phosphodiesterase class II)